MRERLILGTINFVPSEDGWHNTHCDASSRQIWNAETGGVDVDFVMDAADLQFNDESFDEVRMWHTLEHLTAKRGKLAVGHVFRVLKPGGVFDVEVPDLDRLCEMWTDSTREWLDGLWSDDEFAERQRGLLQWFYSEDLNGLMEEPHFNAHLYGYGEESLRRLLETTGFVVRERLETGLALRYRAAKP